MGKLIVSTEAERKMLRIAANESLWAQREVARVFVYLEELETKIATGSEFWNIRDSASGVLESHATLRSGTPIWRLCPTHVHCIAVLIEQEGDLLVLDICNRAEIETVENGLINR
jgi:hypothetical protein